MKTNDNAMQAVAAYCLELGSWLNSQQVGPVTEDPLEGRWVLSGAGGAIEFSAGTFRWYRDPQDEDGDCYIGTYNVLPGVKIHSGFTLSRTGEGISCFSVTQHYIRDRIDGTETPVSRYGLLFVEQMGSPDEIQIYNHRTDSRATAIRS